jgi:hypothetical protein
VDRLWSACAIVECAMAPKLTVGPPSEPVSHRYLRSPEPVYFPVSEQVPETTFHLERRGALYESVKRAIAATATVGSDQFLYWDPTSAKKCLAPDLFVRLDEPHRPILSWKTWHRGAPHLGVEIVSDSDRAGIDWDEKLARYRAAGIAEVVRFDPEDGEEPIRVWDLISGDLVERAPEDPRLLFCETLRLWWTVVQDPEIGPMLRLARDREGRDLLPTPAEEARDAEARVRAESKKARAESKKAREAEARAREESKKAREATVRLEAEVAALRAKLAGGAGKRRKQ